MTVQVQDSTMQRPDQPLAWGRHYAMVRPDHFRVDYRINPYMDLDRPARPPRAPCSSGADWSRRSRTPAAGSTCSSSAPDSPDMVYAMNLGLAVAGEHPAENRVVMSHMRYAERRREAETSRPWFDGGRFRAVRLRTRRRRRALRGR